MDFKDIHFTWFYIGAVATLLFCSAVVSMEQEGLFKNREEVAWCGVENIDYSYTPYYQPTTPEQESLLNKKGLTGDANVLAMGQELFNGNCKQCHTINQRVVGPALANVTERRTVEWLIKFIKFPQKTIARGDKYAVALYKEYNQFMPNHDFMTDAEIKAILSYLTYESQYVYAP